MLYLAICRSAASLTCSFLATLLWWSALLHCGTCNTVSASCNRLCLRNRNERSKVAVTEVQLWQLQNTTSMDFNHNIQANNGCFDTLGMKFHAYWSAAMHQSTTNPVMSFHVPALAPTYLPHRRCQRSKDSTTSRVAPADVFLVGA